MSRQYCNGCEVVKAKAKPNQKKKNYISNDVPNAYKMKRQRKIYTYIHAYIPTEINKNLQK